MWFILTITKKKICQVNIQWKSEKENTSYVPRFLSALATHSVTWSPFGNMNVLTAPQRLWFGSHGAWGSVFFLILVPVYSPGSESLTYVNYHMITCSSLCLVRDHSLKSLRKVLPKWGWNELDILQGQKRKGKQTNNKKKTRCAWNIMKKGGTSRW